MGNLRTPSEVHQFTPSATPFTPDNPPFSASFEDAIKYFNLTPYNYVFGTDRVAQSGEQAIKNLTDLAVDWQPHSTNAGQITINKEYQYYPPFDVGNSRVFTPDSLDLTGYFVDPNMPGVATQAVTANVNYSRVVPVADASAIPVGSVVGFGADQYSNLHTTKTYCLYGTITPGDTVTHTIYYRDNSTDTVTITATADGASTATSLAADIVAQINAHAALQVMKVKAYALPDAAGCWAVTFPRRALGTPLTIGYMAEGCIDHIVVTNSRVGTVTFDVRQSITNTFVISKSGNNLTLSHPVTLTTSSICTISKTRFITVATNQFPGSVIPCTAGLESGITVGQVASFSYQDNSLRRITAVASGQITLETAVYAGAGLFMTVYPIYQALTNSATSNGTVLNFAAVPTGIVAGMRFANYFGSPFTTGVVKVLSTTATTVTLDTPVTVSNGDRIIFTPLIYSGQMWSKFFMAPGLDGRRAIAGELYCKIPDASVIAAWPAFWTFTDTTATATPGETYTATNEIDFQDVFNYFNNGSTNNFNPAFSTTMHGATAQAGSTSNTLVLAATASSVTDAYVGGVVKITGGTGNGQTGRKVTDYNAQTKTITVTPAWTTTPNNTSVYVVESADLFKDTNYVRGNNLGLKPHKLQFILTPTRVYFYLDGVLMRCASYVWNRYKRGQMAVNLAIGSSSTSFNSNGFYPIDQSVYPAVMSLYHLRFWDLT